MRHAATSTQWADDVIVWSYIDLSGYTGPGDNQELISAARKSLIKQVFLVLLTSNK